MSETLGQMKQRHKRELRELKQENDKLIHSISKKDKKAMKQAKAKSKLDLETMKKHHEADIRQYEEQKNIAETQAAIEDLNLNQERSPPKQTRAQRRKQKRLQQEEETRQRIQEEAEKQVDFRAVENETFSKILTPLGLRIKPISADGHCLFNSLVDQLVFNGVSMEKEPTALSLRQSAADYMRSRPDDFLPFLTDAEGDILTPDAFVEYCSKLVDGEPIVWGGQLEIKALACSLGHQICVYSATSPPLFMGDSVESPEILNISFHQHIYSLGDHYNSLVPTAE
eukprot:254084_1